MPFNATAQPATRMAVAVETRNTLGRLSRFDTVSEVQRMPLRGKDSVITRQTTKGIVDTISTTNRARYLPSAFCFQSHGVFKLRRTMRGREDTFKPQHPASPAIAVIRSPH